MTEPFDEAMNIPWGKLEIPPFADDNLSDAEKEKCKNLYGKLVNVLRESCHVMEIHLVLIITRTLYDACLDSIEMNIKLIYEEMQRRNLNEPPRS